MDQLIFTVTDLNNRIKRLFDSDPILDGVYVRGELSNYKIYPSGHHYFTLKDSESSMRCVMFRSSASKLRYKPENGMGVTAFGSVSVYPRDGIYQLYCTGLTPEGMGDLFVAFEQLKAKLLSEGLFSASHKKALPRIPLRIAVITSSAGAAVRDIIRVLGKRWPMAKVIILPVRVQGSEAPPEIVSAISYANKYSVADLIITGRGGGSLEDLWAFNDERVARAIYESEIPVISAVGHEPDVTISDFVADLRAATPSNAAELAVPDSYEMLEAIAGAETRLIQSIKKKLSESALRLTELKNRRVMTSPMAYIELKRMELDYLRNRFLSATELIIKEKRRDYIRIATSLDALSPMKVLSRGYSIAVKENGEIIKNESQVGIGEKLKLTLHSGSIDCRVEDKPKEDK
jgi:exodeoxyribonuclease VII large subunit